MTLSGQAVEAVTALAERGLAIPDASSVVPHNAGLYAVSAAGGVWEQLGPGVPPDSRPLYVGKAERSLASRDLKTHFQTGKTGSSTLRRSVGALLADDLGVEAQPRNLSIPGHFSNFAFAREGDDRLTAWMLEHLRLSTWSPSAPVVLDDVETEDLRYLLPPLNLDKVRTPWKAQVSSARKRMAAQARAWHPDSAPPGGD